MINNEELMQIELDKAEIEKRKAELKILFLEIEKLKASQDSLGMQYRTEWRYRKKIYKLCTMIDMYNFRAYGSKAYDPIDYLVVMKHYTIYIDREC